MFKRAKVQEKKNKFTPIMWVLLAILVVYCLSIFYMLAWTLVTSMKVNQDIYELDRYGFFINYNRYYASWSDPENDLHLMNRYAFTKAKEQGALFLYTFRNMIQVFVVRTDPMPGSPSRNVAMGQMYLYTFAYAGGCAFTSTLVPCITAYACARYKYKFSGILHTVVIVVMMIPIVGSLPSEIEMARSLKVFNRMWGMWIMKANFLGLYFLVFYDIFKSLPVSFSEAAKIDGATHMQIFTRIALPLIKNTFFTVLLIKFITFWNDYQTPKVFMASFPTIANGLHYVMNENANAEAKFDHTQIPARMSMVILTAAPVTTLFMFFQKRLLGNLTMGGVKG